MSDLAVPGKASELSKRERCRTGDHAIDGQAPVSESAFLEALKHFAQWSHFVRKRRFRNLAGSEFTSQRVARQDPLRGISKCCARAVDASTIGRDQSITPQKR